MSGIMRSGSGSGSGMIGADGAIKRRSVEFATIAEEPIDEIDYTDGSNMRGSQMSNVSGVSITVDDLDPNALRQDRSSLMFSGPRRPSVEAEGGEHQQHQRASSAATNETGILSAIRRFTRTTRLGSTFEDSMAVGVSGAGGVGPNQVAARGRQGGRGSPPPPAVYGAPPGFPAREQSGGGADAAGGGRRGRLTIFSAGPAGPRRSIRRSLGTRSSLGSSTSDMGGSGRNFVAPETYCLSEPKVLALRYLINHRYWRAATLVFILVCLFGPSVNDIWLPKSADAGVDAALTVSFVVLVIDIIIRCTVDRSYFAFDRRGTTWSYLDEKFCGWQRCINFRAGSFMFWFDTVALLTVLFRISYINPLMRQPTVISVQMNELGVPLTGWHLHPLSIDWQLMLSVGRVGLMARFIRTSVLVQIGCQFYWLRYLYPDYYWNMLATWWWGGESGEKSGPEARQRGKSAMALASQKQLASSSKGREPRTSNFSISSLGESRRHSSKLLKDGEVLRQFTEEGDLSSDDDREDSPKKSVLRGNKTLRTVFKELKRRLSEDGGCHGEDSVDDGGAESGLFSNRNSHDSWSHVGAAMRELTGQRIAMGALLALIMTVLCSWREDDTTNVMTMSMLYGQTKNPKWANFSVDVAHSSVIPTLFNYTRANSTDTILSLYYGLGEGKLVEDLKVREIQKVEIRKMGSDVFTVGYFDNSQVIIDDGKVELVTTIVILIVWILGVASFAGPVMTLVVEPIERMVKLLTMLTRDPLGYQSSPQYRKLKKEDDVIAAKSMWPKEVLKGMETNFLMNTILRIGSLMKVGFGSAGVEIIRNNLERGRHKDVLFLNKQGGTVSCIFMFCDIRQFTDATECLQEEVFVFTNKIAAVVHSICHSYGGSANKNIGDAFLLSWILDEAPPEEDEDDPFGKSTKNFSFGDSDLYANNNQADKALLSVVKISMALYYDNYFIESMNETARNRLLTKLSSRKGPVVQMGFGLHAGKAVQGAIGSQRKLDATYISESVERAEFLESSTKRYGVPLLMSDSFYQLLDSSNRYRCRKVDQLLLLTEETAGLCDPHEMEDSGEKMNIYTFDMDIEALWRPAPADDDQSTTSSDVNPSQTHLRNTLGPGGLSSSAKRKPSLVRRASFTVKDVPSTMGRSRRSSLMMGMNKDASKDLEKAIQQAAALVEEKDEGPSKELILPTGVRQYNEKAWLDPDIKKIRKEYQNGITIPKFQEGLKSYYARDWEHAKKCFETVMAQRDDGPSKYFLKQMAEHNGVPPRNFIGFNVESG